MNCSTVPFLLKVVQRDYGLIKSRNMQQFLGSVYPTSALFEE
jgi:hypothetical protein